MSKPQCVLDCCNGCFCLDRLFYVLFWFSLGAALGAVGLALIAYLVLGG